MEFVGKVKLTSTGGGTDARDTTLEDICPRCGGEAREPVCNWCNGTGKMPRIVGVALRTRDGTVVSLPKPNRHHNVIHYMHEHGFEPEEIHRAEQGFITDGGMWVRRVPAKLIAQDAGQIIRDSSGGRRELYSEDIW